MSFVYLIAGAALIGIGLGSWCAGIGSFLIALGIVVGVTETEN